MIWRLSQSSRARCLVSCARGHASSLFGPRDGWIPFVHGDQVISDGRSDFFVPVGLSAGGRAHSSTTSRPSSSHASGTHSLRALG